MKRKTGPKYQWAWEDLLWLPKTAAPQGAQRALEELARIARESGPRALPAEMEGAPPDVVRILRSGGPEHGTDWWRRLRFELPTGGTRANKIVNKLSEDIWVNDMMELLGKDLGLLPDTLDNPDTLRGTRREPRIRADVARALSDAIVEPPMVVNPAATIYLASPDGVGASGLLYEFKAPRGYKLNDDGEKVWEKWDADKDELMKKRYKHQVQATMWACGLRKARLAYERFADDGAPEDELRIVEIKFDPVWAERNGPRLWVYLHVVHQARARLGMTYERYQALREADRAAAEELRGLGIDDTKEIERAVADSHFQMLKARYGIDGSAEMAALARSNVLDWIWSAGLKPKAEKK